jgi:hypothetical protein
VGGASRARPRARYAAPAHPEPVLARALRRACATAGFTPRIVFEQSDPLALVESVAVAGTVAMVSPLLRPDHRVVLRCCPALPEVEWVAVYRTRSATRRFALSAAQVARSRYRLLVRAMPGPVGDVGVEEHDAGPGPVDDAPGSPDRPLLFDAIDVAAAPLAVERLGERGILHLAIPIRASQTTRLVPAVAAGEVDVVLVHDHPDAALAPPLHVMARPIVLADPLHVVVGPTHPLASRSSVRPADLAGTAWLRPEGVPDPCLVAAAAAIGVPGAASDGATPVESLPDALASGRHATLAPRRSDGATLVHVRVDHPMAVRRLVLLWRPDRVDERQIECLAAELGHLAGVGA